MDKSCNLSSVPLSQEDRIRIRISQLPDHILLVILSKLTIMEAAQTSVLSHRWLNLWKYVPRLSFDLGEGYHDGVYHDEPFRVLKTPKMEEKNYIDWKVIDKWLEYAFARRVQKIDLNLSPGLFFLGRIAKNHCNFPYHLLNQREGCSEKLFQVDDCVYFSCLKSLCLTSMNISGEFIEVLLQKCPLLEELKVAESGLVNLVISGPSLKLKHLEITYCVLAKSITISNLNIESLKVSEIRGKGCLTLSNLPMLVEVFILGHFNNFEKNVPLQFSCCLSQLTVLTIRPLYPKSIMYLCRFPELGKLRRLVIILFSWTDDSLLGLTSLISFCPNLEEFVLKFQAFNSNPDPVEDAVEMKHVKDCSFKHIKVLELYGYYGRSCEEELISYIIRNSVALKKMVIVPHMAGAGYNYDRNASDDEIRNCQETCYGECHKSSPRTCSVDHPLAMA